MHPLAISGLSISPVESPFFEQDENIMSKAHAHIKAVIFMDMLLNFGTAPYPTGGG